ncbi:MAG: hypothetical protein EOP08_10960, partial [Proteobacteria bacterium]
MNLVRRLALTAALCALPFAVAHAAPPPAEVFFKDPEVREAVLSPTGRRLAMTTSKGMPRVGLVVFDLAPGGRIVRLHQFPDGDVINVRWVNDERLVFGMSDLVDGSGLRSGAPGLFTVKVDGSRYRQLVRRQWKVAISDEQLREVTALDWHHRLIAIPPSQPGKVNEEVLMMEFPPGEGDDTSLVWLNTANNTTRHVDHRPLSNVTGWLTDPHGQPRVAYTRDKDRVTAHWIPPGGSTWARLYESALFDPPFRVQAVDAQGSLLVSRRQGEQGYDVLSRYDAERRAPQDKPLVATPGFDFDGDLLFDDGKTLGLRLNVDGEMTVWFDPAMKAFQERADALFPGRINRVDCRRCGTPEMVALVRSYSDREPGQLYVFEAKPPEGQKNWRLIQSVRPAVKAQQMSTLELHRVPARDGLNLPVWVTR